MGQLSFRKFCLASQAPSKPPGGFPEPPGASRRPGGLPEASRRPPRSLPEPPGGLPEPPGGLLGARAFRRPPGPSWRPPGRPGPSGGLPGPRSLPDRGLPEPSRRPPATPHLLQTWGHSSTPVSWTHSRPRPEVAKFPGQRYLSARIAALTEQHVISPLADSMPPLCRACFE